MREKLNNVLDSEALCSCNLARWSWDCANALNIHYSIESLDNIRVGWDSNRLKPGHFNKEGSLGQSRLRIE
jgi:hypothetical protein